MYPTLNISLLAQPGTAANGDTQAVPLLEAGEVDLAESFQASLARSLVPVDEGGNALPLDGTALPEPVLSASVMLDDVAPDAELVDAVPVDAADIEVVLPGELLPDPLPAPVPATTLVPETDVSAGNPAATTSAAIVAGNGQAAAAATLPSAAGSRPVPARPGLEAAQRAAQPLSATGTSPLPGDRPGSGAPAVPLDVPNAQELALRAAERDAAAAQAAPEARDLAAQRAELALNASETAAPRPGEPRPVLAPSAPSVEPGAILAAPSRPTINIATPVQVSALQSAAAEVPIQTPVGEPGFDDAIADRVWIMTQARLNNAEIRLTPAELGPVRIQVAVDDGTANVSFQAAQAATREAIEQALPRLRELFAENGLSLGQASVGEEGVRDGQRDTREQAAAASVSDDSGDEIDTEAVPADAPRTARTGHALVDTFA